MWFHSWALTLCGNRGCLCLRSTSSHRFDPHLQLLCTFDLQLAASGLSASSEQEKRLKRVSVLYLCVLSDITEAQL